MLSQTTNSVKSRRPQRENPHNTTPTLASEQEKQTAFIFSEKPEISRPFVKEITRMVEPESQADFIKDMTEEGRRVSKPQTNFEAPNYENLEHLEKVRLCTFQNHFFGIRKMPNGDTDKIPRYCGYCEKCLEMQAAKHKMRFEIAEQKAKEGDPSGAWRRKFVPKNSDKGKSLKRQIARKHDKRHFELESVTNPDMDEIWSWSDDPAMGEIADPYKIDWDRVNRQNKVTGRKVSYGGGIRPPSKVHSENTERLLIPEIVVSGHNFDEAERIVRRTNLLEKADNFEAIQDLILKQTELEIEAIKETNIKVHAVYNQFLNLSPEQTLEDWNGHVAYWEGINSAPPSEKDPVDGTIYWEAGQYSKYQIGDKVRFQWHGKTLEDTIKKLYLDGEGYFKGNGRDALIPFSFIVK